jgi:transcriptional regulator with XRE-family HTH domain
LYNLDNNGKLGHCSGMPRQIEVSEGDRSLIDELRSSLGLTQRSLSKLASVTQPWLSQVLKGQRKNADSEMIERVATALVELLKDRDDAQFEDEQKRILLETLSRFSPAAAALVPPKTYWPGGPVPAIAAHYIRRDEDRDIEDAIRQGHYCVQVRGPVQCGKTSLLARLEHRARAIKTETAWFDLRLPVVGSTQNTKPQEINASVCIALCDFLCTQWGLRTQGTAPDSIGKLLGWFKEALPPTASRPRLLIMDDLASLGAQAAEQWLSFVRDLENTYKKSQLSIAVGLTHQCGPRFMRRMMLISSLVSWTRDIEVKWFNPTEVTELQNQLSDNSPDNKELFRLFRGQPYLTHSAIVDEGFRKAVRGWTDSKTADARRKREGDVKDSEAYRRHLTAVRRALLGHAVALDEETARVLQAFVDVCSDKKVLLRPQDREFFDSAKLLNFGSNQIGVHQKDQQGTSPRLEIYRLIAKDLGNLFFG